MRTRATWVAFGAAAVVGFALACVVDLPPDGKYTCTSDADCGGGGWACTPASGGPRYCCKPSGSEVCDGRDNDCDGLIDDIPATPCYNGPVESVGVGPCHGGTQACSDGGVICAGEVVPTSEICNGVDDNCDGPVDDGFDFKTDNNNCGRCGVGCSLPLHCEDGGCQFPTETLCNDRVDNDGDQAADCADSDCVGRECSPDGGCTCRNFGKTETGCGDSLDNDNDGPVDCLDSDCDGGSCGTGCQCQRGGKIEILCGDGNDNDGDGPADCADTPDCTGQSCGAGCTCAGGIKTETTCDDTSDNDGDGLLNCADPDCNARVCGNGCTCAGLIKTETACNDISDNDNDGAADCADIADCTGASCGTGCTCAGGVKTETNCLTSSGDEDGDGNANCADPDCLGKTCRTSPMRTCQSSGACQ